MVEKINVGIGIIYICTWPALRPIIFGCKHLKHVDTEWPTPKDSNSCSKFHNRDYANSFRFIVVSAADFLPFIVDWEEI